MLGDKKTAICPYSVTDDVFQESTNIPRAGQRIYNTTTKQWYTGDGITELRNLIPSTTTDEREVDGVGQTYIEDEETKGEIFNDYENNKAISLNTHSEGANTIAGGKGFKIESFRHSQEYQVGFYTLSSIEGLEVGMIYNIVLSITKNNVGKILEININSNEIKVDNYIQIPKEDETGTQGQFDVNNYLTITGRPDLGDIEIGFNAHAEGDNNIAQGRDSHTEGRDNISIGQYSHTEGRENIAGFAAHAEGYLNEATGAASHAEGLMNKSLGVQSHAEGLYTIVEKNGENGHSEGERTIVKSKNGHAEGYYSESIGTTSHAEGNKTKSIGDSSHAEGRENISLSANAHSEGSSNYSGCKGFAVDSGYNNTYRIFDSITGLEINQICLLSDLSKNYEIGKITQIDKVIDNEGEAYERTLYYITVENFIELDNDKNYYLISLNNIELGHEDIGYNTHSEGNNNKSIGINSHTEGFKNITIGLNSHSEGSNNKSIGMCSHSEGNNTIANGDYSHSEGRNTQAYGSNSHAEGFSINKATNYIYNNNGSLKTYKDIISAWKNNKFSLALGNSSHIEGKDNLTLGEYSHAEGSETTASGLSSHAEGSGTTADGNNSHTEGSGTIATRTNGHAEGNNTQALHDNTHAEGSNTIASGWISHAEGANTQSYGSAAHSEGYSTNQSNDYIYNNDGSLKTHGYIINAWKNNKFSLAKGYSSHVEGTDNLALGEYSHAEGYNTVASGNHQHVQGKYNEAIADMAHIVGNGSEDKPSNAHTLDFNGNAWFAGNITIGDVESPDYIVKGGKEVTTIAFDTDGNLVVTIGTVSKKFAPINE